MELTVISKKEVATRWLGQNQFWQNYHQRYRIPVLDGKKLGRVEEKLQEMLPFLHLEDLIQRSKK